MVAIATVILYLVSIDFLSVGITVRLGSKVYINHSVVFVGDIGSAQDFAKSMQNAILSHVRGRCSSLVSIQHCY